MTNPSEQYVIERLQGLPNTAGIEAATEQSGPNGNLHKDDGYTSAVFFSSDLVDQSQLYTDEAYMGIPAVGTEGGSCVEAYATTENAEGCDTHLSAFGKYPSTRLAYCGGYLRNTDIGTTHGIAAGHHGAVHHRETHMPISDVRQI